MASVGLAGGAIGVEGQFVDQYALQQLFARATRKAIMGWALVTFHQAPASLSRCWITWRWPLSTSPEPSLVVMQMFDPLLKLRCKMRIAIFSNGSSLVVLQMFDPLLDLTMRILQLY